MSYLDDIDQYQKRMGGIEPFEEWLKSQSPDVQMMARKAVVEKDVDSWKQFQNWNREKLWESRDRYTPEQWAKMAVRAGLPTQVESSGKIFGGLPSPSKMVDVAQGLSEDLRFLAGEAMQGGNVWQDAANNNPSITPAGRAVIDSVTGAMQLARRGKEWVKEGAKFLNQDIVAGKFDKLWETIDSSMTKANAVDPVGMSPIGFAHRVLGEVVDDFWSTADLLIPDRLQEVNRDPILRMGLAGPIREYLDMIDMMGTSSKIKNDMAGARRRMMKEQGVPDALLEVQDGAIDFAAVGVEFMAPGPVKGMELFRGAKMRKALELLAKDKSPEAAKMMVKFTEKLAKSMASRGGVLDETGKGAFVGFIHTDGDPMERTQEALLWGAMGAGFGAGAQLFRRLKGSPASKQIMQDLIMKNVTSEEALTAMTGASQEEVAVILKTAVDRVQGAAIVHPLYPSQNAIDILEQYGALADKLNDLQKPMELRRTEYLLRLERESLQPDGTPMGEFPPEKIHAALLEEEKMAPQYIAQMEELIAKNPKVFFPSYNTNGIVFREIPAVRESVSYVEDRIPVDTTIMHTKYGRGQVTQVVGVGDKQKITADFGTNGTKQLTPHASWRVILPNSAKTKQAYYDQLQTMVMSGEISMQEARKQLLLGELKEGDPHARYEVINLMLDELFARPEQLHLQPRAFQETLVDYLRHPDGSHPYFQWMDDAQVLKEVDRQGFAVKASLPFNAWDWVEEGAEGKGRWVKSRTNGPMGHMSKRIGGDINTRPEDARVLREALLDHTHRLVTDDGMAGVRLRHKVMGAVESSEVSMRMHESGTITGPQGTMTNAGFTEGQMLYIREKTLKDRPYQKFNAPSEIRDTRETRIGQELEHQASMGRAMEGGEHLRIVDDPNAPLDDEELIGSLVMEQPMPNVNTDYGYTVTQLASMPWGEGAIMVNKPVGFKTGVPRATGRTLDQDIVAEEAWRSKKGLPPDRSPASVEQVPTLGGKPRATMDKGMTVGQMKREYQKLSEFMSNPDNWQLIRPMPRPSRYSNESARALDAFLKSEPPWGKLTHLKPDHNIAIMTNRGVVFGMPDHMMAIETRGAGWYKVGDKTVRGKQAAEDLAVPQPSDLLDDAAVALDYPRHSLSILQKQKDGRWKIVGGLGEEKNHEMLASEVAEELNILGLSNKDSRYARTLRAQLEASTKAQERAATLTPLSEDMVEKFQKIVAERSPTFNERVIASTNVQYLEKETGLLKREWTEKAIDVEVAAAHKDGADFTTAIVDLQDIRLMDVLASAQEAERSYQAAVRAVRRVADKHQVHIGHWSDDKFAVFGRAKDQGKLASDLHGAFRDILNEAPAIARLLYQPNGPMMVMPSVGVSFGKGISTNRLIMEANARVFDSRRLNKAAKWAQGFFIQGDVTFNRTITEEGPFKGGWLFNSNQGEFIASPTDSEFWEQVAYAKIVREGGKVKIRNKRLVVERDGKVDYTATNMRQLAIIEQIKEPAIGVDLTQEVMPAFAGGYPAADIGGISGLQERPPKDMEPALEGKGEWFRSWWTLMRTNALKIEKDYGFPLARAYDALERGNKMMVTDMNKRLKAYEKAMKGVNNDKARSIYGKILMNPGSEQEPLVKELMGTKHWEPFKKIRDEFYSLYEEMGIPKEVWDDVPFIIKRIVDGYSPGHILDALGKGHVGTDWVNMVKPVFRAYELKRIGMDSTQIFHKMVRAHYKAKYIVPKADYLKELINNAPESELPKDAREVAKRMRLMFLGASDGDFLSMSSFFGHVLGGMPNARSFAQQMPALLLSLQYSSSLGFRVGLPFRNLFQPILTTAPLIGLGDTLAGWSQAFKYLKSEDKVFKGIMDMTIGLEELKHSGAYLESAPVVGGDALVDAAVARGWVRKIHKFTGWGLKMQQVTDRLNRTAAFFGGVNRAGRYLQQAIKHEKDFEWFARHADLNMFHEVDVKKWKGMWDKAQAGEGSWRELLVSFGKRVADTSQFEYATYAQPRLFHSTLGKMAAQYGVWSFSFLDLLKERGLLNSQAKMRFWRRFVGIHGSIASAAAVSGATIMDWTFLYPLDYSGGPYLQWVTSMLEAHQGPDQMKATKMRKATERMGMQMMPLGGLRNYDMKKASEYLATDDGLGALLSMFRLADWPEQSEGGYTEYGGDRGYRQY